MDNVKQLGDFIKGRFQFLEAYCRDHNLDFSEIKNQVLTKALELIDDEEKKTYFRDTFLRGIVLPTTYIPEWADTAILEALSKVLRGSQAPMFTHSSDHPSIAFEAGRHNAQRQAKSIFRVLFQEKEPVEFLTRSFPIIYRKCYSEDSYKELTVDMVDTTWCKLRILRAGKEPGNPIDCDTILGYLYGSLETFGATRIKIHHVRCASVSGARTRECLFDIRWRESKR